jgi:hypothetical protein
VGANLLERDEKALVVSTGYFGDRFADWYLALCLHCVVITYYLFFFVYYYYILFIYWSAAWSRSVRRSRS